MLVNHDKAEEKSQLPHVFASQIPVLFLPGRDHAEKLIVYFDGNSSDMGRCIQLMVKVRAKLDYSVLVTEYAGYGLFSK